MKAFKTPFLIFLFYLTIFFNCEKEVSVTPESNLILPAVSQSLTTLTASEDHLPADGTSSCIVEILPLNESEIRLGSGVNIKFFTTHGEFTGSVEYDS